MNPFDPVRVTAAILAGGAGSRLHGRDKGLQPLAGKPLIAHVAAALRSQAGAVLICINRNASEYAAYGATCFDGVAGYRGPLAGIAAALHVCTTGWLLTVPVDCPRPPIDLARRLHAAVAHGARAAVAHDGGRRQPLFALYARDCATQAADALSRDLPVWRWQDELGGVEVDFADASAAFTNLNSDAEFHAWETSHDG